MNRLQKNASNWPLLSQDICNGERVYRQAVLWDFVWKASRLDCNKYLPVLGSICYHVMGKIRFSKKLFISEEIDPLVQICVAFLYCNGRFKFYLQCEGIYLIYSTHQGVYYNMRKVDQEKSLICLMFIFNLSFVYTVLYVSLQSNDGKLNKDFKTTRTEEQVITALRKFVDHDNNTTKVRINSCLYLGSS